MLPKELNRLLRGYSVRSEEIDMFLPGNCRIDSDESGYVVIDEKGKTLGPGTHVYRNIRVAADAPNLGIIMNPEYS